MDAALEIVDLVMEQHFDPPARQQMLLDGVRALYQRIERPLPVGLSRRVSGLTKKEEHTFLTAAWNETQGSALPAKDLEPALLSGLLASVHAGAHFIPAKQSSVNEQLRGNRYVGIGVALGNGQSGRGLQISRAFPQGVAHKAGIKQDDEIIQIDGVSIEGMKLEHVVDLLRGPEGSTLRLLIKRAGEAGPLSFPLRRSVVHFETVLGCRKTNEGAWNYDADKSGAIAYVQIPEIRGSTLHELRQAEQRLRSQGFQKLILDLRFNKGGGFHDALMLADGLLPQGVIGRVRTSRGESEFPSGPDCLFRDWPLAVLIDSNMLREAEWLAAAVQDGRKVVLVGSATPGGGYSIEPVPLPSGRGSVQMWTKVLCRADGRSLLLPHAEFLRSNPAGFGVAIRAAAPRMRDSKLNNIGVAPDVEVVLHKDWLARWMNRRGANATEDQNLPPEPPNDPQFQEALRVLSELP